MPLTAPGASRYGRTRQWRGELWIATCRSRKLIGRRRLVIRDRKLEVQQGLTGEAGVHVTADSQWWLGFVARERSLLGGLLRRKIRIKGSPKLLVAFGKCFPS